MLAIWNRNEPVSQKLKKYLFTQFVQNNVHIRTTQLYRHTNPLVNVILFETLSTVFSESNMTFCKSCSIFVQQVTSQLFPCHLFYKLTSSLADYGQLVVFTLHSAERRASISKCCVCPCIWIFALLTSQNYLESLSQLASGSKSL